jgi:beta-ketoacyl-acyl-carrier-protein synthase II
MVEQIENRRRVVVTGLGAITPLGSSVQQLWEGWINGQSGIRRITQFNPENFPCQIAGEIPDFEPDKYLERKEARRIPRSAQIAVAAAIQAVADAGLPDKMPDPERCGVIFGTAMGGVDFIDDALIILRSHGHARVNPFALPMSIPNLSGFLISKQFQCLGPNATIITACATGTQTVGEGLDRIRQGKADLMIVGGTEALVRDYAIGGFVNMRALPVNYNDHPDKASRPFDAKREGFIFSEGSAALVIESLEHARNRGARIYAELLGHASSCDGYHIAAPDPEGAGAVRTMLWALQDAGVQPGEIDYINAHGSSTPLNDSTETKAIKRVFNEHAYQLAVSSTKSMIGHAMGASGALEAIACTLAIYHGIIPPTINYEYPDPECDLDYVPNRARKADLNVTLSNSFGLGGQNACLVMKKFSE